MAPSSHNSAAQILTLSVTLALLSLYVATANSGPLRFNSTEYTVRESDGFATVCLEVSCNTTENGTLSQPSVNVATMSESAENGSDFILLNPSYYNCGDRFIGDMGSGGTQLSDLEGQCLQVNISIVDDAILEDDETFTITAAIVYDNQTAGNGNRTTSASARITILDNELIRLSLVAPQRVSEGAGYFSVCVEPDPPPGGIETVFNITAILALSFNDSNMTDTRQVEFSSNSTMACHNFALVDDSTFEENSLATVTLSSLHQRVEILSGNAEIIIEDDDDLVLQLNSTENVTLMEGEQRQLSFYLLPVMNRTIRRSFTVIAETTPVTAVAGDDFAYARVVMTFTPETDPLQVSLNINITDDAEGEPLERFEVNISSPDSRITINGGRITIIIQDNEVVQDIVPMNFRNVNAQSRNISLSWLPPNTSISVIGYTISCSGRPPMDVPGTNAVISGLTPFTNYSCTVHTRVEGNRGESSSPLTIQTDEEIPGDVPQRIRESSNKTSKAITLTWDPPTLPYGIITNYTLRINESQRVNVTDQIYTISGLRPWELVTVSISASNSKGMGPFSPAMDYRSAEAMPDPVTNLRAISTNDEGSTFTLSWSKPARPNGIIQRYNILVYRVNRDCNDIAERAIPSDQVNDTSHTVQNLMPGTPYLSSVRVMNSVGESVNRSVCSFTRQRRPGSPQILNASRVLPTSETVNVTWKNLTLAEARGWIMNYTVHYWDADKESRSTARSNITSNNKFSLLIEGFNRFRTYNIVVTANTSAGVGDDSIVFVLKAQPRPNQGAVIASIVTILLLIIIVTVVVIILLLIRFRRRIFRRRSATLNMTKVHAPNSIPLNSYHPYNSRNGSHASLIGVSSDIPVYEFSEYVKKMHKDSNHLFEKQYRSIKDPDCRHNVAFLPCNCDTKNRFIDIYPYDANRVILKKTGREGSDYINASWIDGYQRKNAYIAAQGPLEETVDDFWRMISENELSTIVMVTRLIEGPKMIEKCKQYWPSTVGNSMKFPRTNMIVTFNESKPFADYCINVFTLKRPNAMDLEVTQFYYQGWPDHGVPQYATSVLGFLRHVRRKHLPTNSSPLLVHCSAGVGRTGTFITLDVLLQKIKEEQCLNVYEFVKQLRKGRCQMVQTESQYVFIHDALNEYITSGDTEIAVANLRIALGKLYQNDSAGFKRQFKLLSEVSRKPNQGDLEAANNEIHQHKNRFPERIPYRDNGLKLKPNAVLGGEYINATFINGYKCVDGFIAAQAPLESTVEAFWRMVWENRCQTIVVLCDVERESTCVRFWPHSQSETYGKLQVTATAKATEKNEVIKRQFDLNFDKRMTVASGAKLSVTLFQHKEWNEDGDQPSCKSVLHLNNEVIRAQISTGNKPIVVVCNDGCGRTGTFLTIYSQIERLKTEQVIDVFQWIRAARIQRAWLVSNQEQYELIYEALSEFIDSFDTYANFKVDNELL